MNLELKGIIMKPLIHMTLFTNKGIKTNIPFCGAGTVTTIDPKEVTCKACLHGEDHWADHIKLG